jgi:hypothetical protein
MRRSARILLLRIIVVVIVVINDGHVERGRSLLLLLVRPFGCEGDGDGDGIRRAQG